MKKFCLKIAILLFFISIRFFYTAYIDTYNVFHPYNVRFTEAEPNKNFIKTKYVVENKDKFNAFVLGSSRVSYIPIDFLPKFFDGEPLNWYNMTYSEGIPEENFLTLKTFVEKGVDVKMILMAFDSIAMYANYTDHQHQFLRMSYQEYEKNPLKYYAQYLIPIPDFSIATQIVRYSKKENIERSKWFYEYGTNIQDFEVNLEEKTDLSRYETISFDYSETESWKCLQAIKNYCDEKNIELVLVTNPMYITNYKISVEKGYFDFLEKVAGCCEFYNFSCLSKYTTIPNYFHEFSHYKSFVGLEMTKILFGTEAEKKDAKQRAVLNSDDSYLFGMKVTRENYKIVKQRLIRQLEFYDMEAAVSKYNH